MPLGLLVLNEPTPEHPIIDSGAVIQEAIDAVRSKIGAFAVFKKAVIVEKLPKTRSGMCIRVIIMMTSVCASYTIAVYVLSLILTAVELLYIYDICVSHSYIGIHARIGKVLRGALRQVANADPNFKIPATVDDPAIFKSFEAIFRHHEEVHP